MVNSLLSLGVRSNTGGDAATLLPTTPEVSPTSSPVPPAERGVLPTASTTAPGINGPSSSATLPAGLTSAASRLPPLPKPRAKPRQPSPDPAAARRGLMTATADVSRNNSGDGEVEETGGAVSNGLELEARLNHNMENSLPEETLLEVKSPPPPPVPTKKTSGGKRIIIPEEDVVFELEDIPMPETPRVTSLPVDVGREPSESAPLLHNNSEAPLSLQTEISPLPPSLSPLPVLPPKEEIATTTHTSASPVPTLPPKDVDALSSESTQIPILPPKQAADVSPAHPSVPTLPSKDEEPPPQSSSIPPLPSKETDIHSGEVSEQTVAAVSSKQPPSASVATTESPDLQPALSTPPLPARRRFVAQVESADSQIVSTKTPPLPRRDTGPPSFSPPPPPAADFEDEGEAHVPPLPPPRTSTLPPARDGDGERLSPPMTLASMPELTGLGSSVAAQREPASDNFVPSPQIRSVWNDGDDDDIIPVVGLESLAPPTTNIDEGSGGETLLEHNLSLGEAELNLIGDNPLPPVLPPKEHQQQPPPPPPITPDDFPEDYSISDMSDSDEESRPLMSIQSTRNQQEDDRMMLAHAPPPPSSNGGTFYDNNNDDDVGDDSCNTTPSSSVEGTPKKKTLIRQSGSSLQQGFTDDDIMVVSPKPPADSEDYMNQETIDKVTQDDDIIMVTPNPLALEADDYMNQEAIDRANRDSDYMNQDAIDQSLADEDDVNATNIEREHFVIRGSSPIKSRTLELKQPADKDRDYENQEIVDEVLEGDIIPVGTIPSPEGDIIPVGTLPSPDTPISEKPPQPVARRDYAYSVSAGGPAAKQKVKRHKYEEMDPVSPTRSNTICFDGKRWIFRNESEEDSGPTSLPVMDNSSSSSAQRDHLVSPKDDFEITSPLESSVGSINQTFPRTASTVSSQYKPPLPKMVGQEQPSSSSSGKVMKQRCSSLDDNVDGGGGVSASAPNGTQTGYNEVSMQNVV